MASSRNFPPYPLFCVPHEARMEIAYVFDTPSVTNITMENLAETMDRLCHYQLRFNGMVLSYLRNNHNSCGPTIAMLREAEKRGANTQILQQAILELGANAHTVLPNFLPEIERRHDVHMAHVAQTGNPRNSTCYCQQCTQINFPTGHYPPNVFQSPQHSFMDSNHNHTLVPSPTTDSLQRRGCTHLSCMHHMHHMVNGQQPNISNIPSKVDRQESEDDNNRQVLRHPHGRCNGPNTQSDPLPLPSECSVGARPRSSTPKPRRRPDFNPRSQIYTPSGCDCKHCEANRHQSDSDETELKTSTSTYSDLSDSFQNGCTMQTSPHVETRPDQLNNNPDLKRERSNSDVSSKRRDDQVIKTRNSNSDSDITQRPPQCTCTKISKVPCSVKNGTIFVSLADHSNSHIQEVLELCKHLSGVGFDIRCDMMDKLFEIKNLNKNEWIDFWFKKADYVLFCISPTYHEFITVGSKKEMEEKAQQAEPNNNRFHTRYIFDRARSEYINNASLNYRFIPVIFKKSGATTKHLPDFLHATLCYVYPDIVKNLSLQRFLLSNLHKD